MEGTMSEIRLFAANFAPKNWALCSGQLLAISTNQALFSLLGTTYGGNGVQTFALPDFRGRIPAGTGATQGGITQLPIGAILGTNTVTATIANLPTHTHTGTGKFAMKVVADGGNTGAPADTNLASLTGLYSSEAADGAMKPITPSITINLAGNNNAISIQQPYLGLNYIICTQGFYPSRN
ncbi:phage tail protein [Flavobacterium aquidurense]|jgi:microcystin-dependent protein|uniref:phage tail protein n=1 Tax=Flavobacterium aquidurense TaxID=362413 RepID=UPI0037569D4A